MKGKTARRMLPEKYRAQFESKTIVCIEYEGLNEDQEREMFQVVSPPPCSLLGFLTHLPESADGNGAYPGRYSRLHFINASYEFLY
jgi:hypothetical protein